MTTRTPTTPTASTADRSSRLGQEETFRLPASGGSNEIGVGIPVGTECRVIETDAGGADATTVSVNGAPAQDSRSAIATIGANGTMVTFTNAFDGTPESRPLPDPDHEPGPDPKTPSLPATGADTPMQLLVALAALLLGGTLIKVTRPRRRGWLRA